VIVDCAIYEEGRRRDGVVDLQHGRPCGGRLRPALDGLSEDIEQVENEVFSPRPREPRRAHLQAEARGARDLLTSVLQANLAQVTVQQNNDVWRISAIVGILAVPTMLAGI
jgi:hypothetical protein